MSSFRCRIVKPHFFSWADIEAVLDYKGPPEELLGDGRAQEESWKDADNRKWNRK